MPSTEAARNRTRGWALPSDESPYSFAHPEFIHPLIVKELLGWISDKWPTVIAVDLTTASKSNRFFDAFSVTARDGREWVEWSGPRSGTLPTCFRYAYVGTSSSGVQIVECYDQSGGSGVFGSVGLFTLEGDDFVGEDEGLKPLVRKRIILKILGSLTLGDRYIGEITCRDDCPASVGNGESVLPLR